VLQWEAPFANYLEITQMQTQVRSASTSDFVDVCVGEWFECRILMTELRTIYGYSL